MTFNSIGIKNNVNLNYNELKINFYEKNKKIIDKRVYLIYGENGVGKTTLSRTLDAYSNGNKDMVTFFDYDDNIILEEDTPIYVYNEDFINNNFIFSEDNNLNAIVMTGKTEDIDEKITYYKITYQNLQDKFNDLNNKNNEIKKNFEKSRNELFSSLRGEGKWADRDRKIKGNRQNSSVNINTINNFKKIYCEFNSYLEKNKLKDKKLEEVSKNIIDLDNKNKEKQKQIYDLKNKDKLSNVKINYNFNDDIEIKLSYILNNTISKHVEFSDELTKKIIEIYKAEGEKQLKSSIENLHNRIDEQKYYCPTCFQEIDEEYIFKLKKK